MDLRKLSPAQLEDLIDKARKRKTALEQGRVERVRRKIETLLKESGLTLDEVFGARGRSAATASGTKGRKFTVKPKYRNPANPGQTWAGRGMQPAWFREALAAGKSESELLIER
jgi:DNA-binding protein H-NS